MGDIAKETKALLLYETSQAGHGSNCTIPQIQRVFHIVAGIYNPTEVFIMVHSAGIHTYISDQTNSHPYMAFFAQVGVHNFKLEVLLLQADITRNYKQGMDDFGMLTH